MKPTDDPDIKEAMRHQAARDVAARSGTGSMIYIVIWMMIVIPSGFFRKEPLFTAGFTLFLAAFAIYRFFLLRHFHLIYSRRPAMWTFLIYSAVTGPSLVWGVVCTVSLMKPEFSEIAIATVISTAGIVAGGAAALAPDRRLSFILVGTLLLPAMVAILFFRTCLHPPEAFLFLVYWIGIFFITSVQNREYWTALENALLVKQYVGKLELMNTQDGMTELRNRRYFNEEYIREIKRAERNRRPVSLLMMDLDHFKRINDTHGHLAGDSCLKMTAATLKGIFKRETDTIARYGGEEFAVILPDITLDSAVQLAEMARSRIESIRVNWRGADIQITVSIGVSAFDPGGHSGADLLLSVADAALYEAKNTGRNKVVKKNMETDKEGKNGNDEHQAS
jgi:diguanylate cyclase (GGDEF)-like protein